ncbi:hypothetical protein H0H92_005852, partial [Tricholoma furcatifolium]
ATIGADFIAKTLPHPSKPSESVVLQIWDTAGQERFSSLSSAFFRGADAALLMFDVNSPSTMTALKKWWAEFRERAPLADEDMEDFCCVVVGNKMDLSGGDERVTEAEVKAFLTELVPPTPGSPTPSWDAPELAVEPPPDEEPLASSRATIRPPTGVPSNSIAISSTGRPSSSRSHSPKHPLSKSRSRSSSHFYTGTMTTTHTTLTIYHTPSSSLFDVFQSARSSPEPWSSPPLSLSSSPRGRRISTVSTSPSTSSTSGSSAPTITPSLFARELELEHTSSNTSVPPLDQSEESYDPSAPFPPPLARGPKLFFTSAKTGLGVQEVFEYITRRVVRRWEYEERLEARRMHVREWDTSDDGRTVHLDSGSGIGRRARGACCGS